nr:MAG TPA: hypothetical protein [Caudoviricetes sp.]
MLKDTILSYINDDGNLVYINDLVSAFDNWQSALGIFLGASNYKFIDISMSNEMDSATFTSGTTQLIFKTSSSLPSLATGTIIIATCNKTFTVTEQNRATVYVWLSDVEQRSSETGQEYTAIKRALFSNTQPIGVSEVATIDLTWDVGMDGYSFYHTYDWRANLVLPSSIGLSDIANGAVGTLKIADGAVTSEKIADGTISTPDIADGAVTSAKIGDYQVTERNIGLGSISNDALQSGSVSNEKIIDYSIDSSKIAALAVTDDKLNLTPFFLNGNAVYYLNLRMAKSGSETQNQVLFETAGINNSKTYGNGTNNPVVTINFTSARAQSIILSVYDESSNFIQKLAKVNYTVGNQQVQILIDDVSDNYAYSINAIIYLTRN